MYRIPELASTNCQADAAGQSEVVRSSTRRLRHGVLIVENWRPSMWNTMTGYNQARDSEKLMTMMRETGEGGQESVGSGPGNPH